MCFAPKPPRDNSAEIARQREEERQARIREGETRINESFGQFDDPFYSGRRDAFTGYYLPQLRDQFEDARKKLIYSLARSGNLNAGTGASQLADLKKALDLNRTQIGGQAQDFVNRTKTDVESAKQDLFAQNRSAADPSKAASSAAAQVGLLTPLPSFNPLADVFAGLLDNAGTALIANTKDFKDNKTGLFSAPKNAVSVVS